MNGSFGPLDSFAAAHLMEGSIPTTGPHCCYPDCGKAAEFGIYGSSGHFEDATETCVDHVGLLLGTPTWLPRENSHWIVYPLPV